MNYYFIFFSCIFLTLSVRNSKMIRNRIYSLIVQFMKRGRYKKKTVSLDYKKLGMLHLTFYRYRSEKENLPRNIKKVVKLINHVLARIWLLTLYGVSMSLITFLWSLVKICLLKFFKWVILCISNN